MEIFLEFTGARFSLAEEGEEGKENIPPLISSFFSDSASPLPYERKPLQDITRLITSSAIRNVRSSPSVVEARPHYELGARTSSKKRKATHLLSEGVVSSQINRRRCERSLLRKRFR